jgi:hypothetical protein
MTLQPITSSEEWEAASQVAGKSANRSRNDASQERTGVMTLPDPEPSRPRTATLDPRRGHMETSRTCAVVGFAT